MSTKRTPLDRRRRPLIDASTLALFVRLENASARERKSDEFKREDRELARRLGLGEEWLCCVQSVTNRRTIPPPPQLHCHHSWFRVRAVREQLLAAAKLAVLESSCPEIPPRRPETRP